MMSGTIIGEIKIAIKAARYGSAELARPSAASVPSVVANAVVASAMMIEFFIAPRQLGLVKKSSYHCIE